MRQAALVGRKDELATAVDALATCGGVVFIGPVGAGKSRLASEVAERLAAEGRAVHRATATNDGPSVPFGLFSHLVDHAGIVDSAGVTRSIASRLRAEATGSGAPVLLIDDGHLADAASATALLRLVETGTAGVVLTVRSGAPAPAAVTALWKNRHIERLDLEPLTVADTTTLAGLLVGAAIDDRTASRIWELTRGNPLYVEEVVRAARRHTEPRHGTWVWRDDFRPDTRLIDALASDLLDHEPAAVDAVTLLAIGGPLSIATVEALAGHESLVAAERARHMTVDAETQVVTLAHPLIGELIRARQPQATVAAWRRRLAEHKVADLSPARAHQPEDDPLRQAAWLLEVGESDLLDGQGPLLAEGGLRAMLLGDYDLANRLGAAALAVLGPRHVPAALIAAQTANLNGRSGEAIEILDAACGGDGPDRYRARAAYEHSTLLLTTTGDAPGALDALDRWEASLADDEWRAFLESCRAACHSYAGDYTTARTISARLVHDGPVLARLQAFATYGTVRVLEGAIDEVCALGMELTPLALQPHEAFRVATFWTAQAQFGALIVGGRLVEAERLVTLLEMANPFADDAVGALTAHSRGFLALTRGHADKAVEQFAKGIALAPDKTLGATAIVRLCHAEALALAGRAGEARAMLELAATASAPDEIEPYRLRATTWMHMASGRADEARRTAAEASQWCRDRGFVGMEIICLQTEVRFGARGDALIRLDDLTRGSLDPLRSCFGALARGLRRRDGSELDAAAAEMAGYTLDLLAAEASTWAAQHHRRAGNLAAATASDALARELAARCVGARSPVLDSAAPSAPGAALTAREHQVVLLVSSGAPNRAIAETLGVSVRTVEGHLLRAFRKLGTSDRADLVERFAVAGEPAFDGR